MEMFRYDLPGILQFIKCGNCGILVRPFIVRLMFTVRWLNFIRLVEDVISIICQCILDLWCLFVFLICL